MDIKTFVDEALSQIIEGVTLAQAREKNKGAVIAPASPHLGSSRLEDSFIVDSKVAQMVHFDLAVTVVDKSQSGGKLSLLQILSLGEDMVTESSHAARVKFKVPVVLPTTQVVPSRQPMPKYAKMD
jgi:hypothetical protein